MEHTTAPWDYRVLQHDHYYGKDEYNNDEDYDGYWGIWDAPFLQYITTVLDEKHPPFFSSIFTVSSHDPYKVPHELHSLFKKGHVPMHRSAQYSDYALNKFFEKAKKSDWYDHTIFLFTADHSNQSHFPFYKKTLKRFVNPFMLFDPKARYKGTNLQIGQHIDIYPTLVELMQYDQPFRS